MANINLCIMAGNLTDQPKTKALQSGTLIAEFSIAVHRRYKDGEDVCFMPVTVWGKMAEVCQRYLGKGSSVMVRGFIKQESWQDQNGNKRQTYKLIAEDVQFLSSGSSGNRQQEQQQPQYGNPYTQQYGNQQRQYTPRIDDADVPGYVPPQKQHGNNQAVKQAQEPIAESDMPF